MSGALPTGFDAGPAVAEIQAAQLEIAEAAAGLVDIERALCAILGACAFQDLSGQRLSKIEGWLCGVTSGQGDPLARGPSLHGDGLDQDAADLLFAATPMASQPAGSASPSAG